MKVRRKRIAKAADVAPVVPAPAAVAIASVALEEGDEPVAVFDASCGLDGRVGVEKAAGAAVERWLVEFAGAGEAIRKAAEQNAIAFWSPDAPSSLFVTNVPLAPDAPVQVVKAAPVALPDRTREVISKAMRREVRLHKTDEERFVFGVVLEPETVDTQNDIYSEDEIRKAAHAYMIDYQQLGKQHAELVTGKLKLLESYIAPCDFSIGEESVKKGSWMMALRAVDDTLWESIKKGEYTAFSIGGSAYRVPEMAPAADA